MKIITNRIIYFLEDATRLPQYLRGFLIGSGILSFLIFTSPVFGEVKIGAIVSLQGGASEQGKNWLNGATLAAEHLKKDGIDV